MNSDGWQMGVTNAAPCASRLSAAEYPAARCLALARDHRNRRVRQSACADVKDPTAAHLRASSKRVARLFRPCGPDSHAGHERRLRGTRKRPRYGLHEISAHLFGYSRPSKSRTGHYALTTTH